MDSMMWFGLIVIIAVLAFAIYTKVSERRQLRKNHKEFKEIFPKTAIANTSTEFTVPVPTAVRDEMGDNDNSGIVDLSDATAITIKDTLGHELCLTRQNGEDDSVQYRELVISDATHLTSSAVKVAVPVAQQMYSAAALVKAAPNGLFTATVNPGMLSRFAKDGSFTTMIHGPKGVVSHNGFRAVTGLSAINPVMAVGVAMQAMAAVSGQYYLKLITARLDSIEAQIDQIASLLTAQNVGVIRHSHIRLILICNHETVDEKDIQEIRSISNDVGQIYETYRELYDKQKQTLSGYNPEGKGAQRLFDSYKKKVAEFYQTTQICALAYQVFMQAKLAEITVTFRLNPADPILNDLRNDALAIYNDPFDRSLVTNPQTAFSWVVGKADECLRRTNIGEELTGILDSKTKKEENRRKQLAPLRESTRILSEYADSMMDHESSRLVLEGMEAQKKVLILPAKGEQRERIFIEA